MIDLRGSITGLMLLVVTLAAAPGAEAEAVQVRSGSIHHQNIETAIQFLRDHGDGTMADEIQSLLDRGKIYVDPELAENAETSALNNVTLNPAVAGNTLPFNRDRPLDPEKDFRAIVELARTLYHENIHANHQSYAYWVFSGVTPGNDRESDAWRKTLAAMDRWIEAERARFDVFYRSKTGLSPSAELAELQKLKTKIGVLTRYLGDYAENGYFGKNDANRVTWDVDYWKNEQSTHLDPRMAELERQIAAAAAPPPSAPAPEPEPEPATEPDPEPEETPGPDATPVEPPPEEQACPPCQPILDEMAEARTKLEGQVQTLQSLETTLEGVEDQIKKLRQRIDGLRRRRRTTAGVGGSSYDPATGIRIDAWDQGDGTVKVTTRDRNGNVIDERTRDTNRHQEELRERIEQAEEALKPLAARAKELQGEIATARQAVAKTVAELGRLAIALSECIRSLCSGPTTDGAVGTGGALFDPATNPDLLDPGMGFLHEEARDADFQLMMVEFAEIRVGSGSGAGSARPERLAQPLRFRRSLHPHLAPPIAPPSLRLFLESLGVSTGEAFTLTVSNPGGAPTTLRTDGIVVEPLKRKTQARARDELSRLEGGSSVSERVKGYCLEFLRRPPDPGMLFRIAPAEIQKRFEPVRRILRASRQLDEAGLLRPDSAPDAYLDAIRQWSIWVLERGFDRDEFEEAFVERSRENFAAAGQRWSKEIESVVRGLVPNRFRDIERVLAEADVPAHR